MVVWTGMMDLFEGPEIAPEVRFASQNSVTDLLFFWKLKP